MVPLQVPNQYLALAPVIVTAPTTRCGTTLIQRLLTGSANAFLYGEEIAAYVASLTQVMVNFLQLTERIGGTMDADFASALAGPVKDWRPAQMPPLGVIQPAFVESYYRIPAALAAHGESIGRPIWGFKRPDLSRDMLSAMLMLMPRAKVVYVYRHLADALKSAKARRFVTSDADVAAFCARWANGLTEVSKLASDQRVLFLKYETLIAEREQVTALLEAFTGASGVSAAAFDIKVNTFAGDVAGYSPTQYIEPAPLTATDIAAIEAHAGPVLAQLYGAPSAQSGPSIAA
jgi:sulfotransferase family protein